MYSFSVTIFLSTLPLVFCISTEKRTLVAILLRLFVSLLIACTSFFEQDNWIVWSSSILALAAVGIEGWGSHNKEDEDDEREADYVRGRIFRRNVEFY